MNHAAHQIMDSFESMHDTTITFTVFCTTISLILQIFFTGFYNDIFFVSLTVATVALLLVLSFIVNFSMLIIDEVTLLNIAQLEYFYVALKTENFSTAARQLHVTPQAVSKSIASLERELGAKLFEKSGRNLLPTNFSKAILPHVDDILESCRSLNSSARAFLSEHKESCTIRLCVSTLHERGNLWELCDIDAFVESNCCEVAIEAFVHISDGCLAALDNDVANTALIVGETDKHNSVRLTTLHPCVVVSESSDLASLHEISLEDLSSCRMARPYDMRNNHMSVLATFHGNNVRPPTLINVPQSLESLLTFVKEGGVVLALKTSDIARQRQGTIAKPIASHCSFKMPLSLAYTESAHLETIEKLRLHLRKTLKKRYRDEALD